MKIGMSGEMSTCIVQSQWHSGGLAWVVGWLVVGLVGLGWFLLGIVEFPVKLISFGCWCLAGIALHCPELAAH